MRLWTLRFALAIIKVSVRSRISLETWEQVKTAYAAGVGLREIARKMKIPGGTVLARAKRERWTKQLEDAKAIALAQQSDAITPMQSAAVCMQERAQRHGSRVAVPFASLIQDALIGAEFQQNDATDLCTHLRPSFQSFYLAKKHVS
jgi:hypothetical protein